MPRRVGFQRDGFRKTVLASLETGLGQVDVPAGLDPHAVAERMLAAIPGSHPFDQKLGPFYDTAGLCRWLNVSRQYVHTLINRERLLGLKTADGDLVYPSFQFNDHGGLLPHLEDVLHVLAVGTSSRWQQALWMVTPTPDWGGANAGDLLKQGRAPEVIEAAQRDADRWAV